MRRRGTDIRRAPGAPGLVEGVIGMKRQGVLLLELGRLEQSKWKWKIMDMKAMYQ